MASGPDMPVPLRAALFEDTLDGYFPFRDSLEQLLARRGYAAAWVSLAHAPIMDLPGVAADAPVPLRLPSGTAGTIRSMDVVAIRGRDGLRLRGAARWSWFAPRPDGDGRFHPGWRLAEPVFVRGIGLLPPEGDGDALDTAGFGRIARGEAQSPVALGRRPSPPGGPAARVWHIDVQDGILREDLLPTPPAFGAPAGTLPENPDGETESLIVSLTGPTAPLADRLAQDR